MLCPIATYYIHNHEKDNRIELGVLQNLRYPAFISWDIAKISNDESLLQQASELTLIPYYLILVKGWRQVSSDVIRNLVQTLGPQRVVLEVIHLEDYSSHLLHQYDCAFIIVLRDDEILQQPRFLDAVKQKYSMLTERKFLLLFTEMTNLKRCIGIVKSTDLSPLLFQRHYDKDKEFNPIRFRDNLKLIAQAFPFPSSGEPQSVLYNESVLEQYKLRTIQSLPEPFQVIGIEKQTVGPIFGCQAGVSMCHLQSVEEVKLVIKACEIIPQEEAVISATLSEVLHIWKDKDLWNEYRTRTPLEDKCAYCQYRVLCGGCRAWASN
jgi:radical SAM protein with 4Fe4S-binding SPASM domain